MSTSTVFVAALAGLCFSGLAFSYSPNSLSRQLPSHHDQNLSQIPKSRAKYVVTFPAYIRVSKNYSFNVVLFEGSGLNLPASFTATLTDDGKMVGQMDFTQWTYGHQQHIFHPLSAAVRNPSISLNFKENNLEGFGVIAAEPKRLTEQFIFIQTDKIMYKPSQIVNFRVLALDRELMPLSGKVTVTVLDAKKNRIRHWDSQVLDRGTFGSSFALSDFVNIGEWTISVKSENGTSTTEKAFTVKHYVLPKYEVNLEFSNNYLLYSADERNYKGYIRAKYTFGKHIRGRAVVSLVRGCNSWENSVLNDKIVNLQGDGSIEDGQFTLSGLNAALFSGAYQNEMLRVSCNFTLKVNVTEEETGENICLESEKVNIYRDRYVLKVHDSVAKNVKPGLPFLMRFQVAHPNGSPIAEEQVTVAVSHFSMERQGKCSDLTDHRRASRAFVATDKNGIVTIVVDVPNGTDTMLFRAHIKDAPETSICESRRIPQTRSGQTISVLIERPIANSNVTPKVGDRLNVRVTTSYGAEYVYLIMAQNGRPFEYMKIDNPVERTPSKTVFSQDVVLPIAAAPRCAVVAWTVENSFNEMLADAVEFNVDGLVRQQVTASFSPSIVKPGGATTLSVQTSEPGAIVAMFAVDKSAKLLRSGNDITIDNVLGTVAAKAENSNHRPSSPVIWRCLHCGWWPMSVDSAGAANVLQSVGIVVKTDATVDSKPASDHYRERAKVLDERRRNSNIILESYSEKINTEQDVKKEPARIVEDQSESVRVFFPETWFWWTNTSNNNQLSQALKAPDTMTSWVFSAFAVGQQFGFGTLESKNPVQLTVFQSFFVDVDIPFATVIRDEQFPIKAVVFNYQSELQQIKLTLKRSPSFEINTDGGRTFKSAPFVTKLSVPANERGSVSLWIRPKQIGNIFLELEGISENSQRIADTMQKTIVVEPEGDTRYANRPIFVKRDLNTNAPFAALINVDEMFQDVPASDIVPESRFFQLQAIGDILGPVLSQLGHQIRLPTGCGEQTMVILAPNVYIYKYLKTIGELTPDLESKTVGFVQQGYQRELGYQRNDGGFSAFGNYDPASSTWLTAFVIRCFNAASKYVGTQIDQSVVDRAWGFVTNNAKIDGTFNDPGRMINLAMKGGATSDVNLAAYIYMTFAEAANRTHFRWPLLARTRRLLRTRVNYTSVMDAYQLSLVAYTMSLLHDDRPFSGTFLDRLLAKSIRKDSFIYWHSSTPGESEVETAAYALLALCNLKRMEEATSVARWLMAQRNSLGGFTSTQDTVVGLQGLAEYASKLAGIENKMKVTATLNFADKGPPIFSEFFVNSTNEMLLQSFDLPRNRQHLRNANISVSGTGVALVQLALRYNVKESPAMNSGDFDIFINDISARKKRSPDEPHLSVMTCIRSRSEKAKIGMVVAEIGVPTGYTADLETTKANNPISAFTLLKRIETGERKLVFYFDSLPGGDICFTSFMLSGISTVVNVQQPVARVYSYYEPWMASSITYPFGHSTPTA